MYIRSTGNISPQHTFGNVPFLSEMVEYSSNRMACIEPDYKDIIDPKMIRRMSRIIRMGVASAMVCLQEGKLTVPDAIITGTAYGCLQDTDIFLSRMVEQHEELLTPTAFIQSTHNTIGAQIGLLLKSNNYNNAFVHRGFSFESALLDGMLLLMEGAATNFLVGAIDELTDTSHAILNRFGLFRQGPVSNLSLYDSISRGTMAGEGSAFFLMDKDPSETDYAKLEAMTTFYKPKDPMETEKQIRGFLQAHSLNIHDIDLLITGMNGDTKNDSIYKTLKNSIFDKSAMANYKQLCGEYPTSTAFALWLAANVIKTGTIPAGLTVENGHGKTAKRILIYNHYQNIHHTLLLLSAC